MRFRLGSRASSASSLLAHTPAAAPLARAPVRFFADEKVRYADFLIGKTVAGRLL